MGDGLGGLSLSDGPHGPWADEERNEKGVTWRIAPQAFHPYVGAMFLYELNSHLGMTYRFVGTYFAS